MFGLGGLGGFAGIGRGVGVGGIAFASGIAFTFGSGGLLRGLLNAEVDLDTELQR